MNTGWKIMPHDAARGSCGAQVGGQAGYALSMAAEYRKAKRSEQVKIAEDLQQLYGIAGVLLVDAQGRGIISAKIASTVHDTFHAFMLSELDRYGATTPEFFEQINLRLAQSVTARNALGRNADDGARETDELLGRGRTDVDGPRRYFFPLLRWCL